MEAAPPVTAITDPANGYSPDQAVKAATEVLADEDTASQKIESIRYLASIVCGGCYSDVEQVLLDALDDCNEKVR